jgi:hypothetical protein
MTVKNEHKDLKKRMNLYNSYTNLKNTYFDCISNTNDMIK